MSRRPTRPLLVLLLVAPHGAVGSLGVGLHSLPGCGHRVAADRPADGDDGDGVRSSDPESSSERRCAICDHLAQGQLAAGPTAGPSSPVAAPHPSSVRPVATLRIAWLASRPRAPPVLSPSQETP